MVELFEGIHDFLLLILSVNAGLLVVDSRQARRLNTILLLVLTVTVLTMVGQVSVLIPSHLLSLLFDRSIRLLRLLLLEVVVVGAWQFLLKVRHVLDMIVSDFNPLAIREEDCFHELWLRPLADCGLHASAVSRR